MDIVFYNNTSDDDTINKSLSEVLTLSGTLKNDCSIEQPSIIVSYSGMIHANYCYIADFGRYYYVENQTILSNNRVRLDLSVDVLQTFRNEILALSVIAENSTTDNDNYLSSEIWTSKVKTKTDIVSFPSGFNESGTFILITAGG